ncbi:MAG TPA: hypothetical protein VML50_03110 [Anaeromyxobacter sp.]|nr:hypothetical protein [Anaeromyxobacter sp.]
MGRRRLRFEFAIAVACFLGASPAGAAEITRLVSVEKGEPFAMQLSARWDRLEEKASISREDTSLATATPPFGGIDAPQLHYRRLRNDLVSRLAVALFYDLELHVELPYVLSDDATYSPVSIGGTPIGPPSTTGGPDGPAGPGCPSPPCALFPVGSPSSIVYHGGQLGDLMVGIAWAALSQLRDDTKPTWVLGVDATFPTAKKYDPAAGRRDDWGSPYFVDTSRGPLGEKIWKWDFYTAVSRRLGAFDPYVKLHVTAEAPSNATYSNCDHAADLAGLAGSTGPQMASWAPANCAAGPWKDRAGARLPWVGGLLFGAEILPFDDPREHQKIAIDLRLWGDYTSSQRFYNELTDLSGRLHETQPFLTMGARAGLLLRASRYLALAGSASYEIRTAHFLSGESAGGDLSNPADPNLNPNYDWRYDAPGNRFRIGEATVFTVQASAVLDF